MDRLPLNGQNTLSVYSGPNSITDLESVPADQILISQNSQIFLILRPDGLTMWGHAQQGNLGGTPIWGPTPWKPGVPSGSHAKSAKGDDGDFVVYDASGTVVLWSTDTAGHPDAYLVLEEN